MLSPWSRRFYLALRGGRRTLLQGYATDLVTTAAAARLWLDRVRSDEVAAAHPFLGSVALARARRRGDRRLAAWLWLYENHCEAAAATRLRPFVALAFRESRLRALMPFTSHFSLSFSTSTDYPWVGDHPIVTPAATTGRYIVRTRDGLVDAEADPAEALRLVLANLR